MTVIVDMHVHTWHSRDSGSSPQRILRVMKKRGIDAVAVTNHGTTGGWREFPRGRVIPGIELYTENGHLLGLWVSEDFTQTRILSFEESVDLIRDMGGLVVIPHPFDYRKPWNFDKMPRGWTRLVDGIEVCNGKRKRKIESEMAEELARKHRLFMTAGSDAHFPEELGHGLVEAEADDLGEFREHVMKGKTRILCNPQDPLSQAFYFCLSRVQQFTSVFGRPPNPGI